jgi:hypothetical protein
MGFSKQFDTPIAAFYFTLGVGQQAEKSKSKSNGARAGGQS